MPDFEYYGLTRCPFCGKEKEESWLTCSRASCEREMLEREDLLEGQADE